ncbi:MAG: ATP-binding protein, partial [Gemmatimonadales bacterium]
PLSSVHAPGRGLHRRAHHAASVGTMTGTRCRLASDPANVAVARAAVRGYLRSLGVDDPEPAVLLVSELVANAVVHQAVADATIELEVEHLKGLLHIEVHDGDPRPPVARPHGAEDEYGRGLFIVESLAESWGWSPMPENGKRVWCDVPIDVAGLA